MEDLRTATREFIEERDWEQFHSPKNLAMALSVEASEIVEHFQWLTEEQSRRLPPEKVSEVGEEIGDVMIYLVELAGKLGIDPVEAAWSKLEINEGKYPAPEGERLRGAAQEHLPGAADQGHAGVLRLLHGQRYPRPLREPRQASRALGFAGCCIIGRRLASSQSFVHAALHVLVIHNVGNGLEAT